MNKTILLLTTLALMSFNLSSLNLGSMSVNSSNEEKLSASIKVKSAQTINPSDIKLENSKSTFIENSNFIDINEIKIEVKEISGGQAILLSTDAPVKGDQYDFNLKISSSGVTSTIRYFGFIPQNKITNQSAKIKPVNSLSSCLELIDPADRLECYDKSLSREKQDNDKELVARETKDIQPKRQIVQDDLFGRRGGDLEEVIAETQSIVIPNELSNVVVKVSRYAADKYTLTLKNGQKWKVLEPTRKGYFKKDQTVSISKGLFGSYEVNIKNLNKKFKVKRED